MLPSSEFFVKLKDHSIKEIAYYGVQNLYKETIRKILPELYVNCAGYQAKASTPLDKYFGLPYQRPGYEKALINGLEEKIRKGDKVTIVGGGKGVTAMKAADLSGSENNITVYEGSKSQVSQMKKNFSRNGFESIETVNAIVGPGENVWGDTDGVRSVSVDELPECDLLELDCEGSEIRILENLDRRPRNILVESHGINGAPTEDVVERLEDLGYDIEDISPAEDGGFCLENDIMVVTAERKSRD